jgi:type III secretory pathway component EscT
MSRYRRTQTAIVLTISALVVLFALDKGAGLLSQEVVIGALLGLCVGVVLLDRWAAGRR